MKSKSRKQSTATLDAQRVTVKGKPMVMLDEATYELLLRKADLWQPDLAAVDARGNYPALEAFAVLQARDILRTGASWVCHKLSWRAAPASGRKRSIASNRAGTSQACRP